MNGSPELHQASSAVIQRAYSSPTPLLDNPDVAIIGSGIMSATLAVLLHRLDPRLQIQMIEVTEETSQEASHGWNNAGTGHAGICELSYTPARDDTGKVPIHRALHIFEQFEHSKQFWSYLVANGITNQASDFIHAVPHVCFVQGRDDVDFLQTRHAAMTQHHFFADNVLTSDSDTIAAWAPLLMEGRPRGPVAATSGAGTEVDYGRLARQMCNWVSTEENCRVSTGWRAISITKDNRKWDVALQHSQSGEQRFIRAPFVFVGAGGGSLPLLQSTRLPESRGLAGFPIGGQWLVCDETNITSRHCAKVYGATPPSSPSLGAGHLDVRRLNGKRQLLFGPFASWTTRFLKHSGSWMDLPASVRPHNVESLLRTALKNSDLLKYLIQQGLQSMNERMEALRMFYPQAQTEHWRLIDAGIRVQTIKHSDRGTIHFGTEVFYPADKSLASLLGASPGASVSVNIALEVVKTCLPTLLNDATKRARMREIIPTFDTDLKLPQHAPLFRETTRNAAELLQLPFFQ